MLLQTAIAYVALCTFCRAYEFRPTAQGMLTFRLNYIKFHLRCVLTSLLQMVEELWKYLS